MTLAEPPSSPDDDHGTSTAGVDASGGGRAAGGAALRRGDYDAWIQGSFGAGVEIRARAPSVAGFTRIGAASDDLGLPDQWVRVGRVGASGATVTQLHARDAVTLAAGSRTAQVVGPVALVPSDARRSVLRVAPERIATLCGHPVDWMELPPA